eukprot:RCo046936
MARFEAFSPQRDYSTDELRKALHFPAPEAERCRQRRRTARTLPKLTSAPSVTSSIHSLEGSVAPAGSSATRQGSLSRINTSESLRAGSGDLSEGFPGTVQVAPGTAVENMSSSASSAALLLPHVRNHVWTPVIMRDHPERGLTGLPFHAQSDVSRILRVPPPPEALLPKMLLAAPPYSEDIKRATEVNLDCQQALEQAFYHHYSAKHYFPNFVRGLREHFFRPPAVLRKPTGKQLLTLSEPVDMPNLLIQLRDNFQVRDFGDEQYSRLMADWEQATNRWQTMFDEPPVAPPQPRKLPQQQPSGT